MRIAITGAAGLFGKGLQKVMEEAHEVTGLRHSELDITERDQVLRVFTELGPELIVHTAALPDIDYCETHPDEAQLVNVQGTRNLVDAAVVTGAGLVHISTDAVFDGQKRTPYVESDVTNPISVYGH